MYIRKWQASMIELCNVFFLYMKNKEILSGINYTFNEGVLYLVKGPNGSGKTTLGKLICGLLRPTKGVIKVNNEDIRKKDVGIISGYIGYLFQNPDMQLFAPTVLEELMFPYELKGIKDEGLNEKADGLLGRFNLADKKDSFPLLMSGGEKQRLAFATIMMRDVRFIILDEPTSSVDETGRSEVIRFVTEFVENGGGAIIITHDEHLESALPERTLLKVERGSLYEV